jgi:Ser/Thr protein kinase RdoA (MazF antagonist)
MRRLDMGTGVVGRYRMRFGGDDWFVRVVTPSQIDVVERVERHLSRLTDLDGLVCRTINGWVDNLRDGHGLSVAPWVDGRPVCLGDDARLIGLSLARLHAVLATSPDLPNVSAVASERSRGISDRLRRPLPTQAARITALLGSRIDLIDDLSVGPVHGDANPGNLLVDSTGSIRFCDFEDTIHTYASPWFDIAMLVERLYLDRPEAITALVEGYRGFASLQDRPGALADAIRVINLRAVGLLSLIEDSGRMVDPEEWHKFDAHARRLLSFESQLP